MAFPPHPGFNAFATSGGSHPGFNAINNQQLRQMGAEPPKIRSTPAFAPLPQHSPTQPPAMKAPAVKKGY